MEVKGQTGFNLIQLAVVAYCRCMCVVGANILVRLSTSTKDTDVFGKVCLFVIGICQNHDFHETWFEGCGNNQ